MVRIKLGHNYFDITEKDIVTFNGASYSLSTQKYNTSFDNVYSKIAPTVAQLKAKKMIKQGVLQRISDTELIRYKFDISKLEYFVKDGL